MARRRWKAPRSRVPLRKTLPSAVSLWSKHGLVEGVGVARPGQEPEGQHAELGRRSRIHAGQILQAVVGVARQEQLLLQGRAEGGGAVELEGQPEAEGAGVLAEIQGRLGRAELLQGLGAEAEVRVHGEAPHGGFAHARHPQGFWRQWWAWSDKYTQAFG